MGFLPAGIDMAGGEQPSAHVLVFPQLIMVCVVANAKMLPWTRERASITMNTILFRGAGFSVKITLLLSYQAVYVLLGVGYNVVSIMMKRCGGRPLSYTNPVTGIVVMLLYGLSLIPGFLNHDLTYRILTGISVIALGYFGVIVHLLNYGKLHLYHSAAAWSLAILINLFGVVLNLISALGKSWSP